MCLGKKPSQPASVRAERVRRSGLHPIEKMLAFLRSVSRFLDTLNGPPDFKIRRAVQSVEKVKIHARRETSLAWGKAHDRVLPPAGGKIR